MKNEPAQVAALQAALNKVAVKPNPKNPWGRTTGGKWRLKQALRQAGLNHSFFTKKRTAARRVNYAEALRALPTSNLRAACIAVWGPCQGR